MTLNDQSFVECADALANRMKESGGSLKEQISFGFLLATSREPGDDEVDQLIKLADANQDSESPLTPVATVLLNLDEVLMK